MPHNSAQISGISYGKLLKYSFSLLAKKRYTGLEITRKLQQYIQRGSKFSDNQTRSEAECPFSSSSMGAARKSRSHVTHSTGGPKFSDNSVDGTFAEASKEPLKNDGMQGNEELPTKLYCAVQRGGSDEVDEAVRVLQRFPKDSGPVNAVIDRLTELKYIDDLQYAKDYLEHRVKYKPRGKFLLTRELTKRGIDKTIINDLWEQNSVDETDMAVAALHKRQKAWPGISGQKLRERAYRFLAGKGFRPDAIYKAVEACYNPSAE